MTEKEKAIEDETIELSNEPTEKKTKKPHRRRAIVITVVVLALLTAGGIAWKTHANRLMAEARADCAAASERLRTATNDWNTLLNGSAADTAKTDRKSVKDAKMLDALSKTMKATIPKTVSCKADSRTGVQEAAKAITANAAWYKTHAKTLSKAVKAVESSKLDKTVDDAQALYDATSGKVQDDKTRASLLDAIKKRDADAIGKAVKTVNESKAAKEKADAEAKAKAEQSRRGRCRTAAGAGSAILFGRIVFVLEQQQELLVFGRIVLRLHVHAGAIQRRRLVFPGSSGSDLHIVIGGSGTPAQNGPSHGEPNI